MSKLIQTRRLLAMVMAVLLIVSLVPVSAFAEMDNGLAGWKGTTVDYNSVDNFYMLQFDGISYGNAEDLVLRATASTNVQMIRAGKTYTVGAPGNDTFVIWGGGKSGYIRVSQYHANLANSGLADGEAAPKQGDVFVVSGDFADKNGNVIITLETTYISVGADDALTFSMEEPGIELGVLKTHTDGYTDNKLFFTSDCTWAPEWTAFKPESVECMQLIRDAQSANIGLTTFDCLVQRGTGTFYLEMSQYLLNLSGVSNITMPLQTGDIIKVSGNFKGNKDGTDYKIHVTDTYIIVGDNNTFTFTSEQPVDELGVLKAHADGYTDNKVFFTSDYTLVPEWTAFKPESVECMQLIRGAQSANIGLTTFDCLVQRGTGTFYLEMSQYLLNLSGVSNITMPLQTGDVIKISGYFQGSKDGVARRIHVTDTYILVGSDNTLTFTTEEPDISCKHTTTTETTVEPTFTAPGYTAVVCDTCKEELSHTQIAQLSAGVQSWNVALSDNIRVNFALTLSVPDVSKAKVRVSVADSVSEYAVSGLSCENGAYSLSVDLAAAQMTDTLSVSFLYGDSTSTETTYSVRGYADRILAGAYSQATKALVREMLSYGGAAQTYFGYHTDRLASDGITGTAETEIPTSCDPMSVSGSISGVTYYGASLVYRNRIAVRIYFTGDVSGCTFQIGEQSYTPVQKDGLSYIEVSSILPQNLDDAIALKVSSGDSTLSVTYSPMNYIVRMSGKNDDNLKNLLKALYNYHLAAQAYLTAPSTIVVEGGTLAEHDDGAELSENMIFVSLADNLLPGNGDDGVTYTAADGVIKLVRGKETVSLSGSIVKYEDGASYELYLEGNVLPMRHNDYLIVEGDFSNAENNYALRISKTYILNTNGTLSFATTEPVITTVIEAGQMSTHANGWNLPSYDENGEVKEWRGIFFTMAENTVAYNTDWSTKFKPTTEDCIQIIRNGVTYDVGNTAAEALIKYSATEYYLETWTITAKPIQNNDILVINGNFTDGTTTFHVSKSMFVMSDDGSMYAISEVPVSIGTMSAHDGTSPQGIYFTMTDNAVPVDSSWDTRYYPISSSTVKRISNGVTTNVGNTDGGTVLKYGENDWWLENSMVGGALQTGETLLVDGYFVKGNTIFRIEASYITVDADGNLVFSNTAPVEVETKLNLAGMQVKETPYNEANGAYQFHFNGVNVGNEGELLLYPTSVNNIQLVRDGTTTGISGKGTEALVVWGGGMDGYVKVSQYLANLANSGIADVAPKKGDVFIVQGDFKTEDGKTQVTVEKTYIRIGENGSFTMGTVFQQTIDGGHMVASNQGWHGNGIHFELENDYSELPADGWNIEYAPTSTSCVTLIRDGVSHEACYIGRGTIVNCSPTDGDASNDLYLKIEPWTNPAISADAGIQDGDILVVNGDFVNQSNGYVLHIEKTYIKFDMVNGTVQFTTYLENTDFGDVTLPTSLNTINYGVWVGSYHLFSDDKLAELKAAGITKLIGIDPQWIGTENSDENGNISMNVFLDRCQKYGITVVAQVRSRAEDGTKYADSWDGTTKPDYADHPALLGFELQDEPMATEFARLADKKAVLKSFAPDKMVFVNLLPSTSGANSLYGLNVIGKNYEDDYIDAFMEQFEPDVLSWDFYATLSGGKIRKAFFSNFEIMAKKNVTKWYTMLSCGHKSGSNNYDVPTEQELRWQMAVALTYGVSDIDHYTYVSHDTDSNYSCMVEYGTWERTALYDDIEKVDNEYLSWGNIYKAYDYVGTGCVNVNSNQMLKELSNTVSYTEYGISSISTAEDLLVGIFEYEGNHAYMLTNAGKVPYKAIGTEEITMTDTTATIVLENSQQYKCVAVISKGEITYMAIGADGTVEIPVGAYEGVFVIPVLN